MNNFEIHNRAALSSGTVTAGTWQEYPPKMYTLDELTKKAQEMYLRKNN